MDTMILGGNVWELVQAQAVPANPFGLHAPINALSAIVNGILIGMKTVWGRINTGLLMILWVCVAFKMLMLWIEHALEKDSVGLVGKWVHALLLGSVLNVCIESMPDIGEFVWDGTGRIMAAFSADPDNAFSDAGGAAGAVDAVWESIKANALALWELTTASQNPDGTDQGGWMEMIANLSDNMTAAFIMVVSFLLMLVFVALVLFQLVAGVFRLVAGLLFMPVGFAFWPIIDDWGQKAISIVVSGMIQMGIISFMLSLLGAITTGMRHAFVAGDLSQPAGLLFDSGAMVGGKSLASLMLVGMVIVMAIGCQVAISAATGIFSGLSFAVRGVSTGTGGGGGGGDRNPSKQSTPNPSGGGDGGGGSPLGAAVAAGATVATGGAAAPAAAGASVGGASAGAGAAGAGSGGASVGGTSAGGASAGGGSGAESGASTANPAGGGSSSGGSGTSAASASSAGDGAREPATGGSEGSEGAGASVASGEEGAAVENGPGAGAQAASGGGNESGQSSSGFQDVKQVAQDVAAAAAKVTKYMNKQINNG